MRIPLSGSPSDAILTVQQPFADAIMRGGKDVENRSWPTNYRGRLWIHAARKPYPRGEIKRSLRLILRLLGPVEEMPAGVVLGHVTLVDVVRNHPSRWAARGSIHWVLADPVPLAKPVPWVGRQGLTLIDPLAHLGLRQNRSGAFVPSGRVGTLR